MATQPSYLKGSWAASAERGALHRVLAGVRVFNPAWLCVGAALALSLIGVYAIDVAESLSPLEGRGLSPTATKQGIFLLVGVFAACVAVLPHYRWLGYLSGLFFLVTVFLLVFLLIPAVPAWLVTPRNGTRGWINLGVVDLQPSELAKISVTLVLARYLRYRKNHRRFLGLIPPGLIAAVPVALITLEPDLGNAILFIPSLFAVLLGAGAKLKHLVIIVFAAALAAPASFPILRPHQQARILGLLQHFEGDRTADLDINMQGATAQRLVGAGGPFGLGPSAARALVHFNRLPERHNDMIFSVVVTRFGFMGGAAVLLLYLLWVAGALLTAATTREPVGRLIAVGLGAFVPAQVFVNVGMNVGIVPIIGITLPFVSYGGSSLVTFWIMTGLIFNVALRRPRPPFRESFDYGDDEE